MNARTENALITVSIPSLQMDEAELCRVLESSVYPGGRMDSIKLVIGYCKANTLDPLTKPVHIVPMRVKQPKRKPDGTEITGKTEFVWRDVIMPGIELYRIKAVRTGVYAGLARAEYGPSVELTFGGETKTEWDEQANARVEKGKWPSVKITVPEWCEITAYRLVNGERCEFPSGRVYWKETYATAGNETATPNSMWTKRPFGQLEKCAEALALRRAFPELGSAPTRDEMEGKTIEASEIDVTDRSSPGPKAGVEMPRAIEHQHTQEPGAGVVSTQRTDRPDERVDTATGVVESSSSDKTPMAGSQRKILAAKLKNAGLTDTDLEAHYKRKLDDPAWLFTDFNVIETWIRERGAKVQGQ